MNYLWDVMLKADRQGIAREALELVQAEHCSPYMEIALECVNTKKLDDTRIEVNALYRFSEIFSGVLSQDFSVCSAVKNLLLDIMLHYFAELDLKSGYCKDDYYQKLILDELLGGGYGEELSHTAAHFSAEELLETARYLLLAYRSGISILLLRKVFHAIFPNFLLYADKDVPHLLLIHTGCEKSDRVLSKMNALFLLFLPMGFETEIYWEHHIGILDADETMVIDQIAIF